MSKPGYWRASVASIQNHSGTPDAGKWTGTVESSIPGRTFVGEVAEQAARVWYEDTDQSSEADVLLRMEDWLGYAVTVRVVLEPSVTTKVTVMG